ncbi:MAG TPA: hypothetical protein VM736_07935 [Gemmatimonadales bacterium]|nr:hypothetical protein [Gemmatimonadales bacterium]
MRRLILGISLIAAAAAPIRAQTETRDSLHQARELYERLELERALAVLRHVVSQSWPYAITVPQRVQAYAYLGASFALIGARDSALLYFRAAIERDPFADLDAQRFTPAQLTLFRQARLLTFVVAVRPVAAARIDPRTERATFTVVTTHAASLRIELRPAGGQAATVLFLGANDGVRDVPWDGLLVDGHLAPPGRYELVVVGRSTLVNRSDSTRVYYGVTHERPPLEDTLPDLRPADLLPERLSRSAGRGDLLRGLGVAAAALVISNTAANGDLGHSGSSLAIGVAGAATIAGITGYLHARREDVLPTSIEENKRRQAARAAANAVVAQRNAAKLAQTVLVIAPAAGMGP